MLTDTETISFLPMLDELAERKRNKGRRELCKTWKCAVKNECGVYTKNTHSFPAGESKNVILQLHLALVFPYIHGEISLMCGAPNYYGRSSPLTDESRILLNVYDDEELVRRYLTGAIEDLTETDRNLSSEHRKNIEKLIPKVVQKAMDSMNAKE